MRPPRLIILFFCVITFPLVFTFLVNTVWNNPNLSSSNAPRRSGFRGLFFFDTPSSLFPPSAIISLTDDNSTFFLARPAAYGPSLKSSGLSGELWVGSGFGGDDIRGVGVAAGASVELGCSDIPGYSDGTHHPDKPTITSRPVSQPKQEAKDPLKGKRKAAAADKKEDQTRPTVEKTTNVPSTIDDGTDDHLAAHAVHVDVDRSHADIQSLQETAEITGKIVLLSRGGCGFLDKTKWAQKRGAIALIVGDDVRRGGLVTMYARGDTSNITIPSIFTSHTTAQLLSSLIPEMRSKANKAQKQAFALKKTTSQLETKPQSVSSKAADKVKSPRIKRSWFGSLFGGSDFASGDSRRPPSSGELGSDGNKEWTDDDPEAAAYAGDGRKKPIDDFVIGEQDWRDPDVLKRPSKDAGKPKSKSNDQGAAEKSDPGDNAAFGGGSTTPGSGEYHKPGSSKESSNQHSDASTASRTTSKGGLLSFIPWFGNEVSGLSVIQPPRISTTGFGVKETNTPHDGLWVTLTPATLSSSPFFDTLLVLVISPLATLSIVYTILLIRSRIRRRRWRAPKSLVDRLPVRIYHAIANSGTNTPRFATSNSPSPTTPLLQANSSSTRQRSLTTSDITTQGEIDRLLEEPDAETRAVEKRLVRARRKPRTRYISSQIECVVCLEEYIDGVSRVMRLPCGHEFHAACITPWLTNRRRTCPICKGDIVRSMIGGNTSSSSASDADESDNDVERDADPSSSQQAIESDDDEPRDSPSNSPPRRSWTNWRNIMSLSRGTLIAFSSGSRQNDAEDRTR